MLSLRTFGEDICDFTQPQKKTTTTTDDDSAAMNDNGEEDLKESTDPITESVYGTR